MTHKHTIAVAEHYAVIPERAGDGSLYEVTNIAGRVVSAHPCAWRAAVSLAQHLDSDYDLERRMLSVTERE